MNQKLTFIADYLQRRYNFTQLCRAYGISRKTGYKWVDRYNEQGIKGLWNQSRKPYSHPFVIPRAIRKAIVDLRQNTRLTLGAKKIQVRLKAQFPDISPPAISTINKVLASEGLTKKRQVPRRVPRDCSPLDEATEPNQL
ncbi:helix-turn-helix domain-containing protein [Gilvimarinus algae]|uniref:Helix-turn-helix domain-containing protein n=1 Tax=Gilvimarinus algae TaxID=3058037 RepID=A0ABT8T8Z0_9GAMM|nr:helix-turn-helix domain-containing protein [Gilvimarinus sp. SDUM040014]MDO3380594.1 helix-turn-helix domain-containing protein [Gilvimarinus sp. SDUM040014]